MGMPNYPERLTHFEFRDSGAYMKYRHTYYLEDKFLQNNFQIEKWTHTNIVAKVIENWFAQQQDAAAATIATKRKEILERRQREQLDIDAESVNAASYLSYGGLNPILKTTSLKATSREACRGAEIGSVGTGTAGPNVNHYNHDYHKNNFNNNYNDQ
ncbi:UNVERIFIED_CONTAM: hypothetical protein HDU68_008857 [Siphonaria sp. JEL0065]|nr:hypothetical protein HDU68_008857 [Siphonaria sp. JEL0065]